MALDRVSIAATNLAAAIPALASRAMTTVRRESPSPGGGCRATPMRWLDHNVGPAFAGATGLARIPDGPVRGRLAAKTRGAGRRLCETPRSMAAPFDPQSVIGRWQFELTDRFRQFHRERLAQTLREPAALEQAMAEVEREASGSAFEISAAGELTSYVDGVPYFRTTLDLDAGPVESLRIDKPTGPVTLRLTGRDTLVMIDPERGELAYRRHSPAV